VWKGAEKMANRKPTKKTVRQSLIDQLTNRSADISVFVSLIDDYMQLWDLKEVLLRDIRENGLRIPYDNGGGQSGFKDNPSVKQVITVNTQMLRILSQLDLTADTVISDVDDEL
jgi:hypothetical protein